GAASGIGLACARRFADDGAKVVGVDLQNGPNGDVRVADVADESSIRDAVDAVVRDHGRLDVVLNAAGVAGGGPTPLPPAAVWTPAGVAGGGPIHLLEAAEWERVIRVNLTGTFLVCKHALTHMVEQKSGSLVNIASIEGGEGTEGGRPGRKGR